MNCLAHWPTASYSVLFTWTDVESSAPLPALKNDSLLIGRTKENRKTFATINVISRDTEKERKRDG